MNRNFFQKEKTDKKIQEYDKKKLVNNNNNNINDNNK